MSLAHKVAWQSPSNIALVKYWGKKAGQIPANASISLRLTIATPERKYTGNKLKLPVHLFISRFMWTVKYRPALGLKLKHTSKELQISFLSCRALRWRFIPPILFLTPAASHHLQVALVRFRYAWETSPNNWGLWKKKDFIAFAPSFPV